MNSNSDGIEIARFRKLDCCSDYLMGEGGQVGSFSPKSL